jgi:hypothetical protein
MYGNAARNRGFKEYMAQVTRIEERTLAAERHTPQTLSELVALRQQVGQIKTKALDMFAREDLADKDLLLGFLVQVNDVRDFLTRVILRGEESETNVRVSTSTGE